MKDLDLPAQLVDMEDMETKKNLRQYDEAFVSPNEEVQVKFLIDIFAPNLVYLFLLLFMTFNS